LLDSLLQERGKGNLEAMNGPHQDKNNFVPDLSVLTAREEELVRRVEEDNILQWREEELKEQAQHCLYQRFQNTAAALTQVYQGQVEEGRDWQPFQTAAGSLTLLYKDSLEELRKAAEINRKLGHQRTRVDVTTWAKSKRRFIRREELLAFLAEDSPGQGEGEGLDRLSLSNPRRAPVVLPSLQDMLDLSRLSPGHRKRSSPPSPQQDEEMEHSPQSKRSRKN
jgi:hypothetical protein